MIHYQHVEKQCIYDMVDRKQSRKGISLSIYLIMTLSFKILFTDVPNQIIFHVLSSVNNNYTSLNTKLGWALNIHDLINPPSIPRLSITTLLCF